MSCKMNNNFASMSSCDRFKKHTNISRSVKSDKSVKIVRPRKVLASKTLHYACPHHDGKSCSTGIINRKETLTKPKKTTKSDVNLTKQNVKKSLDCCKRCGDFLYNSRNNNHDHKTHFESSKTHNSLDKTCDYKNLENRNGTETNGHSTPEKLQQFYRNENFCQSTDSLPDIDSGFKKISLDTIKETSELNTDSLFKIHPDTEEVGFFNTESYENLKKLQEFRRDNYFECHSAKKRIQNKGRVVSMEDHKCFYRFYLNDRLFPVPITTDHQNNVRCVECQLPVKLDTDNIKGIIQAKVKIGSEETKDIMLFLPVKEQLIIKERRTQKQPDNELFYFGVIKLSTTGDSIFNRTVPENSLALRYQKGYKEFHNEMCTYKSVDETEIITI